MRVAGDAHRQRQAIMPPTRGLTLQAADCPELERQARSQTLPVRQVQRARLLLALAAGQSLGATGRAVGMKTDTVAKWRDRYLQDGLDGLVDRPRSGCPPTYTAEDRQAMWSKLQEDPPAGHTRWSLSLMARETGISKAQLARWWSAAGIQPHRARTGKLSDDPQFAAKLQDLITAFEKEQS